MLDWGLGTHGAPAIATLVPAREPRQERKGPAGHEDPGDDDRRVPAEVGVRVEHDGAEGLRTEGDVMVSSS